MKAKQIAVDRDVSAGTVDVTARLSFMDDDPLTMDAAQPLLLENFGIGLLMAEAAVEGRTEVEGSRETAPAGNAVTKPDNATVEQGDDKLASKMGRRRGVRPTAAVQTFSGGTVEPTNATPATAPAASASRRGRRSTTADSTPAPIVESAPSAEQNIAPTDGGRRGRRGNPIQTSPQSANFAEKPTTAGGRRRGTAATSGSSATAVTKSPSEDKVSDADLMKAASAAAGVITPAGVKEILAEFKASAVIDLKPDQRRAFLNALKKAQKG